MSTKPQKAKVSRKTQDAEREPDPPKSGTGRSAAREEPSQDLTPVVGRNLRRFRSERALSLEALSKAFSVSRAMLGQVELGQSTPTINVVWKIARALDVPFSALISEQSTPGTWILPRAKARVLASSDGAFVSRALFPMDRPRNVEFYELRLAPRGVAPSEAHAKGTAECLIVLTGILRLHVADQVHELAAGDSVYFEADVPHAYENPGRTEARYHNVILYPR